MSVRFMDGFERYGTSGNALGRMYGKWTSVSSASSGFNLVAGRYGGSAVQLNHSNTNLALIPYSGLGSASQLVFGFNFRMTTLSASWAVTYIPILSSITEIDSSSSYRGFAFNDTNWSNPGASNLLGFYIGRNAQFWVSFTLNSWHNLQTIITGTSGILTWQFYLDGVLIGTSSASATGNAIGFRGQGGSSNHFTFDDVFLIDNVVRGSEPTARIPMDLNGAAPRIDTRFPSGDVAKTWDSTGATAFDQVNDAPLTVLGKNISINGPETNQDFTLPALPTVNIPLASRIELVGRGIAAGGTFKMRANDTLVSTHNAPAELGTMSSDVLSGFTKEQLDSMTIGIAN